MTHFAPYLDKVKLCIQSPNVHINDLYAFQITIRNFLIKHVLPILLNAKFKVQFKTTSFGGVFFIA